MMCESWILFLLNRTDNILFSDLESLGLSEKKSMVFVINQHVYTEASAFIKCLEQCEGHFPVIGIILSIIPLKILNLCYKIIAKHRKKIRFLHNKCRVLNESERVRFIKKKCHLAAIFSE